MGRLGRFAAGVLLAAVWWGATLPAQGRATEPARRMSCGSNLKQIAMALRQYGDDYDNRLPPDLRTLFRSSYLSDEAIFRCPSAVWDPAVFPDDYLYHGAGRKLTEQPAFRLLEDRPGNHVGGYCNYVFSDGRLEGGRPAR